MKKHPNGFVAIYLVMLLATVAVTAGVALVLYPAAERTPSFQLSLVMLCFAEALLFAFPIYHGRAASDRRAPAFVFGFGYQAALVIYAGGVVLLCLLTGVGTLGYTLVERTAAGDGAQLQQSRARGDTPAAAAFDGLQHTALAVDRVLPAGMSDVYEVGVALKADPAAAARLADCSTGGLVSKTVLSGDAGSTTAAACLGRAVEVTRSGDLEIHKMLIEPPTPRAGTTGLFDLRYRIEVHNTRWFVSLRTLAIAHTVWFLCLLLTSGAWRIGSGHATQTAATARSQRLEFIEVRSRFGAFAANVGLERHPALQPFITAMNALKDDVAFATPETLPGTESYNGALLSALERLGAEYGRVRAQIASATPGEADIVALVDKARAIAVMVRERDAAIRAAR